MGKRRERRQQQASSRRVKLDLSSDDAVAPSETPGYHEVLGSSLGEKVTAGASNQEAVNDNPLSLLGQYSDDEADEEDEPVAGPANNANFGARKDSSKSQNEQVVVAKENAETAQLVTENLSATGNTSADVKQSTDGHVMHDDERLSGNMSTSETWMKDETTENEWQAVLHEDSGEYYYWNIRTGETTWVKPALLERVNAGGSRSTLSQSAASGVESASLVMSSESGQIKDAQGESDALDSIPKYEHDNQPTENCLDPASPTKDKHLENISSQEGNTSLKPGVDDLKAQMEPVPDASNAHLEPNPIGDVATLREELGELEVLEADCRVGSDAGIQEKVKCETENLQVDEERQEKTTSAGKDEGEDVNLEVVEEIQAVAGTNRDELREVKSGSDYRENEVEIGCKGSPLTREPSLVIETGKEGVSDSENAANFSECTTSLLGTEGAQITVEENAANFSECIRSLLGTGGAQITVEERRAFLAESGEALQQRLSKLAGDSLGRVSRHALMAIQTKARIADWKDFFSLGFSPEACWSFMQSELKKIKSVLAAEEAAEIGRPKGFESSSGYEARHEERPAKKDAEWTLDWGYYQQGSGIVTDPWKQGQPIGTFGNDEDVEEGEIRTSHGEIHTAYANITEGTTGNNNLGVCDGAGGVDVDMEVDMEVDDEIEAEPAVPGMSSDERPSYEAALPLTNLYTFPGSMDTGTLTPPDSIPPGEPPHFFPYRLASNSWVPPLPPDEQWAPPPPGETESFPPPPPEEPPPLPPLSPQPIQPYIIPSVPSAAQVGYFTSEYATEYLPSTEYIPAPEYQSVPDSSMYSAYVEEVPGGVYSNSPQPTEAGGVEQPYMVASESSSAYNGWTATVLPPTPLSFPSVASGNHLQTLETSALIPSPDVPSIPTVASTTADSSVVTSSLEVKKLAKGKAVKKRTHSVAAAPMLNKKVSSLVNKWKQAKEELHGIDEDEDDKALYDIEVLEKKKQKEIEEWRRQQIASGEALENANFQPLGTVDWRERVKRARKADAKKGEAHAEPPLSEVGAQKEEATKTQKPNLTEISKGLLAGWQAYWDEESGEVYYGNLTTQETTWDRPVT